MPKNSTVPRPEHPKPQFERESWINLNGQWTYAFDFGKSGSEKGFKDSKEFNDKITVPFCPESELSGVGHKDFIEMMWYQKNICIPLDWKDKKVILHFGAVDYIAEIFVDGKYVGRHFGGSSSFSFDISDIVRAGGKHSLVVHVTDDMRNGKQPGGKQSFKLKSAGCHYTRTTGIWQTVWLEAVTEFSLLSCRIVPDLDNEKFLFTPLFKGLKRNLTLSIAIKDGEKLVVKAEFIAQNGIPVQIEVKNPKVWSPENPFLYDILFEVVDNGKIVDSVKSYAGMRKVHVEGNSLYLNNKPYYLRLVLDQGFYPDGIQHSRFHADLYDITKALDPTRPVNETSGYVHVKTDLWTVHNYEQDPEKLKAQLTPESEKGPWRNFPDKEVKYQGQPYFVDEFGGIKWIVGTAFAENTWGYGDAPKSLNEVYIRLEEQVNALLGHKHIRGYCYTQLTDVEQEQNGIYNYDRSEKFDMERINKIFSRKSFTDK
jgi:hypothetical protein